MKVFTNLNDKVNFVDARNVFVGYDLCQSCCEHADWFVANEVTTYHSGMECNQDVSLLDDYVFDPTYFEELECTDLDDGHMVVFKLVCLDKPSVYLHLFNCHNGYYAHGFVSQIDGDAWQEGVL